MAWAPLHGVNMKDERRWFYTWTAYNGIEGWQLWREEESKDTFNCKQANEEDNGKFFQDVTLQQLRDQSERFGWGYTIYPDASQMLIEHFEKFV